MLMYSFIGGLYGILVLSKIKYPIASEGLHTPRPPASEIQYWDSPSFSKS